MVFSAHLLFVASLSTANLFPVSDKKCSRQRRRLRSSDSQMDRAYRTPRPSSRLPHAIIVLSPHFRFRSSMTSSLLTEMASQSRVMRRISDDERLSSATAEDSATTTHALTTTSTAHAPVNHDDVISGFAALRLSNVLANTYTHNNLHIITVNILTLYDNIERRLPLTIRVFKIFAKEVLYP